MKHIHLAIVSFVVILQLFSLIVVQTSLAQTPMEAGNLIAPRGVRPVPEEVRVRIERKMEEVQQKREEAELRLEEKKEAAEEERNRKREDFQNRLKEISDQRKQAIVERMDAKMNSLNENWTNHAIRVLERLAMILGKIEVRTDRLEENSGADVSSVREAILVARTTIEGAQEAVEEQAGKSYMFEIGEENNLGGSVSSTIAIVRADIKGMMDAVGEAREAVHDALKALVAIHSTTGETEEPEISATPSSTIVPSPSAVPTDIPTI